MDSIEASVASSPSNPLDIDVTHEKDAASGKPKLIEKERSLSETDNGKTSGEKRPRSSTGSKPESNGSKEKGAKDNSIRKSPKGHD